MSQQEQAKQSFLSLMLTVVIPAVLLMKLGTYTDFSALQILFVALSFPAAYGLYELKTVNSVSFLAIFGFVSVLLTGGVAALQLQQHPQCRMTRMLQMLRASSLRLLLKTCV